MGPLIPQSIINGDLNFFFALIIGIAFGFILEQAGFSSSRKLAGVFYGYDFVVLKVFFTAGVTAATGLFFLKYLGWVNFDFLYINPLYLWSALVGGVIMGFGFILGGFCPGTSLAAAVIGKIDAWFFIIGMFIGVFLFGIFYPFFEPLHMGNFLGNPFIYDTLGLSQKWFLFFLILMALTAFAVTQMIQNKSSKFKELLYTQNLSIRFPLTFILILAILVLFLPDKRNSYANEVSKEVLMQEILNASHYSNSEKIAHSIIHNTDDIHLIDVRIQEEFNQFHLPEAINIPYNNILKKENESFFHIKDKKTVLYSNGTALADMAWFILTRSGMEEIFVLKDGLNGFYNTLFNQVEISDSASFNEKSRARFLDNAKSFFKEGKISVEWGSKSIPSQSETPSKAVKGGC